VEEAKKTTPDEGKTFDRDTVFVCAQDCWTGGVRRRKGEEVCGRVCPPWFNVKPPEGREAKK